MHRSNVLYQLNTSSVLRLWDGL